MKQQISNINKSINKTLYTLLFCCVILLGLSYIYYTQFDRYENISQVNSLIKGLNDKPQKSKNLEYPYSGSDLYNDIIKLDDIINSSSGINQEFTKQSKNFLANLETLGGSPDNALNNLNGKDKIYYFNLGNINIYKAYIGLLDNTEGTNLSQNTTGDYLSGNISNNNSMNNGDNISSTNDQDFIKNYETILGGILSYKKALALSGGSNELSSQIQHNKQFSEKLKYLADVKLCIYYFKSIIESLNDLIELSKQLNEIFDKELKLLQKLVPNKDKKLEQCLIGLGRSANLSMKSMAGVNDFFTKGIDSASKKLNSSIENEYSCYDQRNKEINGIRQSIDKIGKSLTTFYKNHGALLDILQSGDMQKLKEVCDSQQGQQNDKANNDLNEGLKSLDQQLNDNKKKTGEQEKQDQNSQRSSDKPLHQNITEGEQQLFQKMEQQQDNWINEMQNTKQDPNYSPQDYLKQLFKDFLGNDKDYKAQDNLNNNGYDRKW